MRAHSLALILLAAFVSGCVSKKLAAIVELTSGSEDVRGTVCFEQIGRGITQVKGTIYGLKPGVHGVHIHENSDISNQCANIGDHFDPYNEPHGVHVGDVANIIANDKGVAELNVNKTNIRFNGPASIIGQAFGVDAEEDLYGDEKHNTIACGVIKGVKPPKPSKTHRHHHPHHHEEDDDQ